MDRPKSGRITKAYGEYIAGKLIELGTLTNVSREIGVPYSTITNWRAKYSWFKDMLTSARAQIDDNIYDKILKSAMDGDLDSGKWILTRPGHRYNEMTRIKLEGSIESHSTVKHDTPIAITVDDEVKEVLASLHIQQPDDDE